MNKCNKCISYLSDRGFAMCSKYSSLCIWERISPGICGLKGITFKSRKVNAISPSIKALIVCLLFSMFLFLLYSLREG